MKKIITLTFFIMILLYSQAEAKDRFGLSGDIGHTIIINKGLDQVAGSGKTSFALSLEYNLGELCPQGYFTFLLGLKAGKLPLSGTEILYEVEPGGMKTEVYTHDWDWSTGVVYVKVLIERGLFTPFVKIGTGLYHLDLKIPPYTGFENVSKSYLGFNLGFGTELTLIQWLSIFAEFEDNLIPIRPALELPLGNEVKSAVMVNPKIGVIFRF